MRLTANMQSSTSYMWIRGNREDYNLHSKGKS